MKTTVLLLNILLCLGLTSRVEVHADNGDQNRDFYLIETRDGSRLIETLITEDENAVVIRTEVFGEVTIARIAIIRMEAIDPERLVAGVYWFENPQRHCDGLLKISLLILDLSDLSIRQSYLSVFHGLESQFHREISPHLLPQEFVFGFL